MQQVEAWRDLIEAPPAPGDVLVLDSWLKDGNVYEMLRHLAGRTKCRTYVLIEGETRSPSPCRRGATGDRASARAPSAKRALGESATAPASSHPKPGRGSTPDAELHVPRATPRALTGVVCGRQHGDGPGRGRRDQRGAIDPVTGLLQPSRVQAGPDQCARRFRAPAPRRCSASRARRRTTPCASSVRSSWRRPGDTDDISGASTRTVPVPVEHRPRRRGDRGAARREHRGREPLIDLVGDRPSSIGIANFPSPNIDAAKIRSARGA